MGRHLLWLICYLYANADNTTSPSVAPSSAPSVTPSSAPSGGSQSTSQPSSSPSSGSSAPTGVSQTLQPSQPPSAAPSGTLSYAPTLFPTQLPTSAPTLSLSGAPSSIPSTSAPTIPPTAAPTAYYPYCTVGFPTVLRIPGSVNYSVAVYNASNAGCVWNLLSPINTTVVVNFSSISIDETSLGCADCQGYCLNDQVYSYNCSFLASVGNCDLPIVQAACPSSCGICGTCNYNYITVSDSVGEYLHFCGTSNQSYVIPAGSNNVRVELHRGFMQHPSDGLVAIPLPPSDSFQFTWSYVHNDTAISPMCSGTVFLNASTTPELFASNVEGSYLANTDCAWVISAPDGQFVIVEFLTFDLQDPVQASDDDPLCVADVVQVYNPITGESLAILCGKSLPTAITSSTSQLAVVFQSDDSSSGKGFTARYYTSTVGATYCSGAVNLTTEGEVYESPNYPYSNCMWTITAPPDKFVQITFSSFSLEGLYPECLYDYLTIQSVSGLTLLRSCGTDLPVPVTSITNQVIVMFTADEYVSRNGFRFQYSWVSQPGPTPAACVPGNLLYAPLNSSGYIQDGSTFATNHALNLNCSWRVLSPGGTHLHLDFLEFALNPNCNIDFLTIWNGPNRSSPLVGTFCGNNVPPSLDSATSALYVEYVSLNARGRGFLANYAAKGQHIQPASACQGTQMLTEANGTSGTLTDGWAGTVPSNAQECVWSITAPQGSFVKLTVNSFSTDVVADGCRTQYLSAFDGSTETSYAFFAQCGTLAQLGVSFTTTQRTLLVHFLNAETALASFSATWQFVTTQGTTTGRHCDGVTNLPLAKETSGVIRQAGALVNMRRGLTCGWIVNAPANSLVRTSWAGFKAQVQESAGYCGDYVSLDDATQPTVKVCSSSNLATALTPYTTAGSVLTVRMQEMHGLSFNLSWAIVSATPGPSGVNDAVIQDVPGGAGKVIAAVLVPVFLVVLICFGMYCWRRHKGPEQHLNLDEGQELDHVETGPNPRLSSDVNGPTNKHMI